MANFFSQTATPVAQSANVQGQAAAASTLNGQQTTANIDANAQTQNAAIKTDPAPLEAFKSLWETAPNTQGTAPTGVLPAMTAEQLSKTLANSNFLSGVNPEILAKAAGGDTAAFSDVINQGLRTVMTQSVLASHGLVEAGAKNHGEQLRTSLPSMVRSSNVQDSLQSNPLFNNPAAKPMVEMVRAQLETKHPQASAREIAEMTQQFVTDFAKLGNPEAQPKPVEKGKTADGDTDWYAVLGLG